VESGAREGRAVSTSETLYAGDEDVQNADELRTLIEAIQEAESAGGERVHGVSKQTMSCKPPKIFRVPIQIPGTNEWRPKFSLGFNPEMEAGFLRVEIQTSNGTRVSVVAPEGDFMQRAKLRKYRNKYKGVLAT